MPLQPHPQGDPDLVQPLIPVAEAELRDVAPARVTAAMDRLEADAELQLNLALHRYEGLPWTRFADVLAAYGLAVICAWVRLGKIRRLCEAKGIHLVRSELRPQGEEAEDIASDVVVLGIEAFRDKVLIPGRWNPKLGASLKTFFVGQCLFQYPPVYRAWLRARQRSRALRLGKDGDVVSFELRDFASPMGLPDDGAELCRQLSCMQAANDQVSRERLIAVAETMGFSYQEIGAELSMTAKAVDNVLYRRRTKAR